MSAEQYHDFHIDGKVSTRFFEPLAIYWWYDMRFSRKARHIFTDTLIITASIWAAIGISRSNIFTFVLAASPAFHLLAVVFAGSLFTSVITVPSSIVLIVGLSDFVPLWQVVLLGAAGAVAGDYLLFRFVKERVAKDIAYILVNSSRYHAFVHLIARKKFRYVALLFAGLIIASPLPDELAVTVLGVAKSKDWDLVRLSFVFNCMGILTIVTVGNAFAG